MLVPEWCGHQESLWRVGINGSFAGNCLRPYLPGHPADFVCTRYEFQSGCKSSLLSLLFSLSP